MYCTKCGAENPNGTNFCTKCGNPMPKNVQPKPIVEQEINSSIKQEEKKKGKKKEKKEKKAKRKKGKFLFIFLFVLLLFVGIGVLAVLWYMRPEQQIVRALEAGEFDEAIDIYYEDENVDDELLEKSLSNRLEALAESYVNREIEYEVALMELDAMENMDISYMEDLIEKTRNQIAALNESRTAFNSAENMMAKGQYEQAINQYKQVIQEDEDYENAKGQLASAIEQYRNQVLETVEEYVSKAEYAKADSLLQKALKVISDDSILGQKAKEVEIASKAYNKEKALTEAQQLIQNSDWKAALNILEDAHNADPEDMELLDAYNNCQQQYVDAVLVEAQALTEGKQYVEALGIIDDALSYVDDSTILQTERSRIQNLQPVNITSLPVFNTYDRGWSWNEGAPVDPFGNDYSDTTNYIICSGYNNRSGDKWGVEYRVYGEYQNITGTLAPYEGIDSSSDIYLQIFVDDELVYTSPNINRKTDAFDFNVSIKNAEYLRLEVQENSGYGGMLILSNVFLNKE